MKTSKDSTPQPPPYTAVPAGSTTAPYPVQPGAPPGVVGAVYPAPPGHPHSGVPVSNVIGGGGMVVQPLTVGPKSCIVVCPACRETVQTDVKVVATSKTHMFALLLAVFGCCLCCCIPYCVDSLKATHHYCPNCKAFIAAYDR